MPAVAKRTAGAKPKGPRFGFISEIIAELKKVVWPSREQTIYLTVVVLLVSIALGIVLGLADWGFTHLVRDVFLK